ncbi:GTPase-activating protein S23 [Rhizophlyctis rosea]|nr:GTPase-activating protein S23 [Rhizophlyctis rosea]
MEMGNHEERVQAEIQKNKEKEAKIALNEKAKQMDRDRRMLVMGGYSGSSSAGFGSGSAGGYGIHFNIEKISVTANKDGGLQSMEVKGDLILRYKTHPNVDKPLFADSVIALKDPSKPFPSGQALPGLGWRYVSEDQSSVSLAVNCWPSPSGHGTSDVNIEYEMQSNTLELSNEIEGCCHFYSPIGNGVMGTLKGTIKWIASITLLDGNPLSLSKATRAACCRVKMLGRGWPQLLEGPGLVVGPELKKPIRSHNDIEKDVAKHLVQKAVKERPAKRAADEGHVIDIFTGCLDQIGLSSLVILSNRFLTISDSFKTAIFKQTVMHLFNKDAEGQLQMGFEATLEVQACDERTFGFGATDINGVVADHERTPSVRFDRAGCFGK